MHRRPLIFILGFIGYYLLFQLVYTYYLSIYQPNIDPISRFTAECLRLPFKTCTLQVIDGEAKIRVIVNSIPVFNIKEGCNGISVLIATIAFLLAYRARFLDYIIFLPFSVIALLFGNLLRLFVLVWIKLYWPQVFFVFHEYFFPAILYAFAFLIMVLWVKKLSIRNIAK